jgi:hypothetical protein
MRLLLAWLIVFLPFAPAIQNPGLECAGGGYVPQTGIRGNVPAGWTARLLSGDPTIDSARGFFLGSYCASGWVEHLEGDDALVMAAQDIETPPVPGKSFDAMIYQQVSVQPGTAYSLSAWMVSFCGGSFSNPNDCPSGYYMAKWLGIDPAGGTDPDAPGVVWTENRQNFTESRWVNLRLGATAQADKVTVFARIRSPFQHHGNHALIDGVSLLQAPTAHFDDMPAQVTGQTALIQWEGALSPDIRAVPGGTYKLAFDVQYRLEGSGTWQDWVSDESAGSRQFTVAVPNTVYRFRVRALAEQPSGSHGAWPNHRYPGDWVESAPVSFVDHPPLASDDTAITDENSSLEILVLANDSDPDAGQRLAIWSVGPAQHGTATADGSAVLYQPELDFYGSDVFTYTVSDGWLLSQPATVSVTVTHVDQAPRVPGARTRLNGAGESVNLPLQTYDPEGEPVSVRAEGLPPGLALDCAQDVITGTLPLDAVGVYPVTIVASDPGRTTTVTFDWWVVSQVWRCRLPALIRR